MNLLLYVTSFALIFSLIAGAFFQKVITTHTVKSQYFSYVKADRSLRNKIEKKCFKKLKRETPKDPNNKEKKTERKRIPWDPDKVFISHRCSITDNSKLNIFPLLTGDDPLLIQTFERLIKIAYGESNFYKQVKKRMEFPHKLLVKEILISLRKMELSKRDLLRVQIEDGHLKELWHKLIRGTYDYDPKKGLGYPPITDLIILSPNQNRKPICMQKATVPLLKAFLGDTKAEEVLQKEKEKCVNEGKGRRSLKRDEFEPLLTDSQFMPHKKFLQYDQPKIDQKTYRTIAARDYSYVTRKGPKETSGLGRAVN